MMGNLATGSKVGVIILCEEINHTFLTAYFYSSCVLKTFTVFLQVDKTQAVFTFIVSILGL